ncbi:MAG: dihydroorotate dehydrogenase electron transfer subunit [Candidatus Omnitrophica bacterium]|nr:dihydroorotate dehydrogenase electron transfer subunit [Candidatus Omnitrophota bacterium]
MHRKRCLIVENKKTAPGHWVMKLRCPEIARAAAPGQFVQILCADTLDPLLPRPFSFLTADSKDISILYQVVGKGTKILAALKRGENLWVLGPLGNGFSICHLSTDYLLVGGGVGIPPLYHLARTFIHKNKYSPADIHVFLGARNKSLLLCEKDFKKLGVSVYVATDDGSKGHKGFVTELLLDRTASVGRKVYRTRSANIYACGPTPMLKTVSALAQKYDIPCEVSVEVPMACGFGACLGCAVKVRGWKLEAGSKAPNCRFAIGCVEGPVFQAKELVWD